MHGVDSTSDGKSYLYDNVGNQTLSAGRTLEYTAFNKVSRISDGIGFVEYLYGPNNEKILKTEQLGGETNLTWYVGGVEVIIEGWSNGVPEGVKTKRYMANALVTHHDVYNIDINYMHSNHLGSLQAITQQNHHINGVHHLSHDAFGKRRNALIPDGKFSFFNPVNNVTDKGFTGQDHIDQMGLINFNARLYDPNLGMMLQADTLIPDGPAVDSVNRYAYVYNNPLSYTDPSGHLPSPFGISLGRGFNIWYNLMQVKLPADATDSDFGREGTNLQNTPEGTSGGAFGNGDLAFGIGISQNIKKVTSYRSDLTEDGIEEEYSKSIEKYGNKENSIMLGDELEFRYSTSGSKGYDNRVNRHIEFLSKNEYGKKILEGLAKSGDPINIYEHKGEGGSHSNESIVAFDPRFIDANVGFKNSIGKYVNRRLNPKFVLGHELYHSWQQTGFFNSPRAPSGTVVPNHIANPAEVSAVRYTNQIRLSSGHNYVRTNYTPGNPYKIDSYNEALKRIK